MSTDKNPALRSVTEVARDLHVSKVTVYRAVARGELAAVRLGETGTLRIREAAVERFLQPVKLERKKEGVA